MKTKHTTLFLVPGSHFDLGWCASPEECLAYADQIIKNAVDAMTGPLPEYTFTVEYAMFLRHFLETFPDYLPRIRTLTEEGKFQVGSTMSGGMEQILGGELLIRQITHAKQWAGQVLDVDLVSCQHTDLPGHTIQMPQILSKAGIKNISYSRFCPPVPLHWWAAPDGSRVLAAHHSFGYGWGLILREPYTTVEQHLPGQIEHLRKTWPADAVLMAQERDLGMPILEIEEKPTFAFMSVPVIIKNVREWNAKHPSTPIRFAVLNDFFDAITKSAAAQNLPSYKGEMPYGFYSLPACRPEAYGQARSAEHSLLTAEKLCSFRQMLGLGQAPAAELNRAWEDLFYAHDHNVGGRHGRANDEVRLQRAQQARVIGEEHTRSSMVSLLTHVHCKDDAGVPVMVCNPMSWGRTDVVEVGVVLGQDNIRNAQVKDAEGNPVDAVCLAAERSAKDRVDFQDKPARTQVNIAFLAEDVPALGYKVFYVSPQDKQAKGKRVAGSKLPDPAVVENRFFRLRFKGGFLHSLIWKQDRRELIKRTGHNFNEVVVLEDLRCDLEDALEEQAKMRRAAAHIRVSGTAARNFTGKEWRQADHDSSVSIVEDTHLRKTVKVSGRVLSSSIEQHLTLYEDLERIDFTTSIRWRGRKNTMVLIAFPFRVPRGKVTYEVPFAGVTLGEDEMPGSYQGTGGRFVQNWVDISNDDFGVVFSTRNCCHRLTGTSICPIILRTAYSCGDPFYWYGNEGTHTFRHSITPHAGRLSKTAAFKRGWEFNNPFVLGEIAHPMGPVQDATSLPETLSFLEIDKPNVIVSALRKPEDGDGWEVRLFETEGTAGEVQLRFSAPVEDAWQTDLMGRKAGAVECEGETIGAKVDAYGIHTFRFLLRQAPKGRSERGRTVP